VEETVTNRLREAVGGIVCHVRDVHDQVQSDIALAESEARFRTMAETASEGLWLVSPQGDTLFANARMAEIIGVPLQQMYREEATSLVDPATAVVLADRLATRAARGAERYELDFVHPGGERRRLAVAASPLPGRDGAVVGSLAMVSDVTEERHVERELRRAALHDALTGLPNRALLMDRLSQALRRGQGRTAVVFLDLDRFKQVNDSRGHDVGDALLSPSWRPDSRRPFVSRTPSRASVVTSSSSWPRTSTRPRHKRSVRSCSTPCSRPCRWGEPLSTWMLR
jgi:PAS domain S-box-containing protein